MSQGKFQMQKMLTRYGTILALRDDSRPDRLVRRVFFCGAGVFGG